MKITDAQAIEVFKCLTDENRLLILRNLKVEENQSARELLEKLNISQSTLSHHMKALSESGLVEVTRDGKRSLYKINEKTCREVKIVFNDIFIC